MIINESRIRILVVDDERLMRRGVVRLLATEPAFVVVGEAANGEEAVDLVRERCPDVVVMDVRMPVMDGVEATRLICAEHPETVVIGFSAHCEQDVRSQLLDAGASDFVQKSDVGERLLNTIHRYTGQPDSGSCRSDSDRRADSAGTQGAPPHVQGAALG